MATITVGQENGTDIDIYYEDHGSGQPVVSFTAIRSAATRGRNKHAFSSRLVTGSLPTIDGALERRASRLSVTITIRSQRTSKSCSSISTWPMLCSLGSRWAPER